MPIVARDFLQKVSSRKLPRLVSASEKLNVSARDSQFRVVDTRMNLSSKLKQNFPKLNKESNE